MQSPPAALAEVADGRWYSCMTPELEALRETARRACWHHNTTPPAERGACSQELAALFAAIGEGVFIEAPFHASYGRNISLGDQVYLNAGCVFVDTAPVKIGRQTMLGPAVHIY
ncbi:maltose acetyltransferase domain-containing protein, partial [Nostoc sp. NIES-2111]